MNSDLETQSSKGQAAQSQSQTSTTPDEVQDKSVDSTLRDREQKDTYVKLAMRNMVKKGGTSLFHFALTTVGVMALLVLLAIAFH